MRCGDTYRLRERGSAWQIPSSQPAAKPLPQNTLWKRIENEEDKTEHATAASVQQEKQQQYAMSVLVQHSQHYLL